MQANLGLVPQVKRPLLQPSVSSMSLNSNNSYNGILASLSNFLQQGQPQQQVHQGQVQQQQPQSSQSSAARPSWQLPNPPSLPQQLSTTQLDSSTRQSSAVTGDVRRNHSREAKGKTTAAAFSTTSSASQKGGGSNHKDETLDVLWKMINEDRETKNIDESDMANVMGETLSLLPDLDEGGLDELWTTEEIAEHVDNIVTQNLRGAGERNNYWDDDNNSTASSVSFDQQAVDEKEFAPPERFATGPPADVNYQQRTQNQDLPGASTGQKDNSLDVVSRNELQSPSMQAQLEYLQRQQQDLYRQQQMLYQQEAQHRRSDGSGPMQQIQGSSAQNEDVAYRHKSKKTSKKKNAASGNNQFQDKSPPSMPKSKKKSSRKKSSKKKSKDNDREMISSAGVAAAASSTGVATAAASSSKDAKNDNGQKDSLDILWKMINEDKGGGSNNVGSTAAPLNEDVSLGSAMGDMNDGALTPDAGQEGLDDL